MNIKCLTPDCDGVKLLRGICNRCYNRYRQRIKKGQTSWEKLEEIGACSKASKDQNNIKIYRPLG